jgi:acyl CoA:acetate/3-ketoacid CoA transferase beta subunit
MERAMTPATLFERFLITSARELVDGEVAFVGFHWPMVASRIARRLHAPDLVVVFEGGVIEDRETPELSTSPSDLRAAVGAPMVTGSIDALYGQLASGRVVRTMLEAPIVDRRGNVNTSVVGDYDRPKVRLPGSGGGTELGSFGRGLTLMSSSTDARSFPERVDYITSPGYLEAPGMRRRLGYPADRGPKVLITPLGRFTLDDVLGIRAESVHPGVDASAVAACFPWMRLDTSVPLPDLPEPTSEEVSVTRDVLREARATRYRLPEATAP